MSVSAVGSASNRQARSTPPLSARKSQCGSGQSWVRMTNRGTESAYERFGATGRMRREARSAPEMCIMAKSNKKDKKDEAAGLVNICRNRRALHEYEILDTVECGIVLVGTEVK